VGKAARLRGVPTTALSSRSVFAARPHVGTARYNVWRSTDVHGMRAFAHPTMIEIGLNTRNQNR
jgi:hypothetical protein